MRRPTLNKQALQAEREQLRLYRSVLPSLELKRQQLMMELNKVKKELERRRSQSLKLEGDTITQIPMLANREIDLAGLVRISSVTLLEENVVGVKLPKLGNVAFAVIEYSILGKPPWVDFLVVKLQRLAEDRVILQVLEERVRRLERAYRRITQRVNLFEKMLIPEALDNIRRIRIFLSDAERAAVVRSKMMKARRRKTTQRAPAEKAGL